MAGATLRQARSNLQARVGTKGSPSGEIQFSTKGTTEARERVAFWMSIHCRNVRREQASAAGVSRPGTYHNVRLYSSRNWDQRACPGVSGGGHVLR